MTNTPSNAVCNAVTNDVQNAVRRNVQNQNQNQRFWLRLLGGCGWLPSPSIATAGDGSATPRMDGRFALIRGGR